MDKENFVQNIKFYCSRKNVKPTVACRESGVGTSFINNIEKRGQTPSVEKVQLLARYLGVTVSELLGETSNPQTLADLPETAVLRDSAVVLGPEDFALLTVPEVKMILAYRRAAPETRRIIDAALAPYKKGKTTNPDAG